jgi:Tfp pilus assembly protein PilZ
LRPVLVVPIKDRAHFLEMYFEKGGLGGMFIRGLTQLSLGDEVELQLRFLEEAIDFRVKGTVRWRRTTSGRKSLPPGLGIEFLPESGAAEQKLLAYAMGHEVSIVHRGGQRYGAQLAVKLTEGSRKRVIATDDLSEGGAFLLTDGAYEVGDLLTLNVRPPGAIFGIALEARVAWCRGGDRPGVGVEFRFDNTRQKQRIEKLVAQLKTQLLGELRVRVPQR